MRFQTFPPVPTLAPFVKSFIIQEKDAQERYAVLPDTALVIGFQYRGRLAVIHQERRTDLAMSGITGLLGKYRIFENAGPISTLLVVFQDGGAAAFAETPMHELFGQSIGLDSLFPPSEVAMVEEQLCEADTDQARIEVVSRFLCSKLVRPNLDPMVAEAVRLIRGSAGTLRISELASRLHTSQSPLEKRFRRAVGATPKKYSSIVRLHYILDTHRKNDFLALRAYEAGYFDQAHFIHDFKAFTGQTPEQYFSGRNRLL